jgi:methanogenic corrinoid protein MtbC1
LDYLTNAIKFENPALFTDYIKWAKVFFNSIKLPEDSIQVSMQVLKKCFNEYLPEKSAAITNFYVDYSLDRLDSFPTEIDSFIDKDTKLGMLAFQFMSSLLRGDRDSANKLIMKALEQDKYGIEDIYLNVFQTSQQEHFCTAATQTVISRLYPYIFSNEKNGKKIVTTSVSGELHEIGIRMVSDIMEMKGWETYYMGANTPVKSIIDTVIDLKADVLAISTTITKNLESTIEIIKKMREKDSAQQTKIIVGGYPFNLDNELWKKVNADGYAKDALDAVILSNNLTEK